MSTFILPRHWTASVAETGFHVLTSLCFSCIFRFFCILCCVRLLRFFRLLLLPVRLLQMLLLPLVCVLCFFRQFCRSSGAHPHLLHFCAAFLCQAQGREQRGSGSAMLVVSTVATALTTCRQTVGTGAAHVEAQSSGGGAQTWARGGGSQGPMIGRPYSSNLVRFSALQHLLCLVELIYVPLITEDVRSERVHMSCDRN